MFKVCFGWGLRGGELAMLDTTDFRASHRLPEFGAYGQLHVRYGKSQRGGGPQRRTVLTVFDWAVEVIEQYMTEIPATVRLRASSGAVRDRARHADRGCLHQRALRRDPRRGRAGGAV